MSEALHCLLRVAKVTVLLGLRVVLWLARESYLIDAFARSGPRNRGGFGLLSETLRPGFGGNNGGCNRVIVLRVSRFFLFCVILAEARTSFFIGHIVGFGFVNTMADYGRELAASYLYTAVLPYLESIIGAKSQV
jgi:hypothetical protein